MKEIITKQFYIGLIAHDEDRAIAMEVLPTLEDMLNDKVDLLSLDTPFRELYITLNFTVTKASDGILTKAANQGTVTKENEDMLTKANEPIITKADGAALEVEVLLSRELLRGGDNFESELRKELQDALSKEEGVPEEVVSCLGN
jgi:hypothetical protein